MVHRRISFDSCSIRVRADDLAAISRADGDVGDSRLADRIKRAIERWQTGVESPGVAGARDVLDAVARVGPVVLTRLARRQVILRVAGAEKTADRGRHRGVVARVAPQ